MSFYIVQENGVKCLTKNRVVCTLVGYIAFIIPIILTYRLYWTQYDFYCIFFFFIALTISQLDVFIDLKSKKIKWCSELSMALYIVHIPVAKYVQRFVADYAVWKKYILYYGVSVIYAVLLLVIIKKVMTKEK